MTTNKPIQANGHTYYATFRPNEYIRTFKYCLEHDEEYEETGVYGENEECPRSNRCYEYGTGTEAIIFNRITETGNKKTL